MSNFLIDISIRICYCIVNVTLFPKEYRVSDKKIISVRDNKKNSIII